jgi:hypothetical protein
LAGGDGHHGRLVGAGISQAPTEKTVAESDTLYMRPRYYPNSAMLPGSELLSTINQGAVLVSCGSGSDLGKAALATAIRI